MKDINATVMVNLDKSEEEIFRSIKKDTRWGIKKAINEGVKIKKATKDEEWNEFYDIYLGNVKRNRTRTGNLEDFRNNSDVLLLALYKDKIIAGQVFKFGDEISAKHTRLWVNASLLEYQKYYPNNLLYWEAIKYSKSLGFEKCNLGGWQINARGNMAGVNRFKEKWGQKEYFYKDYPIVKAIGRKIVRNSYLIKVLSDKLRGRGWRKMKNQNIFKNNIRTFETKESVEHYENQKNVNDVEKTIIEKYFNGKVLDMGCGVGRTTKYLHDLGFDVVGVDIVGSMIKRAKKIYPEMKFEQGNACNLKYGDNEFDVVFFSFNGLDYISPESSRIIAIKEINRVLKPGGHFVYSSHNPLSLFFKFRPKFILRGIKTLKLFSRYKPEKDANFGLLYTYFASPKKQVKQVESNTDFKFVEQLPNSIKERQPHYVFRKQP